MKWLNYNFLSILGIFFISIVICFDLVTHVGTPATFDGLIHITTMEQYYRVLQSGEFPVRWLDKFANYGLPLPLFAHQFTAYVGAGLIFLNHDPVLTFNIIVFISIFLSAVFYYYFLLIYFNAFISFVATILFSLAPYRIIDIYIRGDLPELVAEVFLPLILIGLYLLIQKKQRKGFYLVLFSFTLLALSHPLMLMIYMFFIIPYVVFLMLSLKASLQEKLRISCFTLFAIIIGTGIASYYLLPLKIEMKYFYFNQTSPIFGHYGFSWENIFLERWHSHIAHGISTRLQIIQTGFPEAIIVVIGLVLVIRNFLWAKKDKVSLLTLCVLSSCLILFFTLPYAAPIYEHTILQDIQFPWRMLAIFIFIPPLLLAIYLKKLNNKFLYIVILIVVLFIRVPQLYGKDYINYSKSSYDFTSVNLYAILYNTIWTGKTETYPIEKTKPAIISGKGKITKSIIHNSSRIYSVVADTPLRMVDYTFYFPGWKVYVDGKSTLIEFQDPNYRGIITYDVPSGRHIIVVEFENTKVHLIGDLLSVVFIAILIITIVWVEVRDKREYIKKKHTIR